VPRDLVGVDVQDLAAKTQRNASKRGPYERRVVLVA
jgi:hypothetical protein